MAPRGFRRDREVSVRAGRAQADVAKPTVPEIRHRGPTVAILSGPASVLALQRLAGNRAVSSLIAANAPSAPWRLARTPGAGADAEKAAAQAELDEILEVASDLVEEETGARPKGAAAVQNGLRRVWGKNRGTAKGEKAKAFAEQIQDLRNRLRYAPTGTATPRELPPKDPVPAKHGPPTVPPSPGKTPPASSKSPPTATGPELPQRPLPADEAASAAKQAGRLKSLAGRFTKSVGRIADKVFGPISVALQILDAIELIEMTESAVRGEGFVFREQLRESSELSAAVRGLIGAYRDSRLRQDLDELVRTAVANDEKYSQYDVTPGEYWGTEELSEFCQKSWSQAFDHATACEKLHDHLSRGLGEVDVRWKYCEAMLSNPTAMTALSFPTSSPAARVFAAFQDLGQMHRVLSLALDSLTEHLTIVKKDLQVLDDNILQTGLVV